MRGRGAWHRRGRRSYAIERLEHRRLLDAAPVFVSDINAKPEIDSPDFVQAVGSTVFFNRNDGVHGDELWKSDGTFAGTSLVEDITPGYDSSIFSTSTASAGGLLYFAVDDGEHGEELWKSDGTEAGTNMVTEIVPGEVG